ncbi:CPBP family glutamic-type intramembrane protease [Halobacteria archaeon AArc-curdl1]|uniref:CPBP family glutamic-type intramembrane protease n=1 Tax=Natronosalvus hydrolyticus TaxID=2979988 RepID=A0AAP2Z7L9_9EURY|nr:CPBP family glutamic-type intramembrane protease [Halobacteria archaeon AArc-curdl1]
MTQWVTFAGITAIVLVVVLVLTRLTAEGLELDTGEGPSTGDQRPNAAETVSTGRRESKLEEDSATSPRELSDREGPEGETADPPDGRSPATPTNGDADPSTAPGSSEFSISGPDPETSPDPDSRTSPDPDPETSPDPDPETSPDPDSRTSPDPDPETLPADRQPHRSSPVEDLSTMALLANVALSQGLFAGVLIGAVVYTGVPLEALGIAFDSEYLQTGITVGVLAGITLYVGNELGAAIATHFGLEHDEGLRALLAPDSAGGWIVLLGVVLPVVALFEELLFRAALIGALSAGFDIPLWILAVGSSAVFALGHGAQGRTGIVVTGLLGLVLAWLFITTGSLLVVVVAHYLINALEFLVHEWLGFEWTAGIAN